MKEQESKIRTYNTSYPYYNIATKEPVDKKIFIQINNLYSKFLIAKVLSGKEITMPSLFGTLAIYGSKKTPQFNEDGTITGLPIDWKKTKELWERNEEAREKKQRVFHMNAHSGGVTYKFWWAKISSKLKNKTAYSLQLSRTNKRALPPLIRAGKEYYLK